MHATVINAFRKQICNLFGHRWRYINYSNHMKENGDKYDFKAARKCTRCYQQAYFYNEWVVEKKSLLDYESSYFSTSRISINNTQYT